jgi:hypothetical protein
VRESERFLILAVSEDMEGSRMMTRTEHLAFAKARALEYVKHGQLDEAINSMASDLNNSPDFGTTGLAFLVMAIHMEQKTPESVTKWIKGFNS